MKSKYLETGKIVGTHGIKGEIRVLPWSDSAEFLTKFSTLYLDNQGTVLEILASRVHGNVVLMKIKDVDTIEAAERLRNKIVFIDRNDIVLDDKDYFIQDLIGCNTFDADTNELLGEICDVSKTGANDVWHIKREGKEYLVPAISQVVIDVDIDANKVIIRPIKGIFDDED